MYGSADVITGRNGPPATRISVSSPTICGPSLPMSADTALQVVPQVDDDALEYLRRLVLGDDQILKRFRNLVASDYNRLLDKCLVLSRVRACSVLATNSSSSRLIKAMLLHRLLITCSSAIDQENHDQMTELQELRLLNKALLDENEKLREKSIILVESVKQSSEENAKLMAENVQLTKSPSTRLIRKPMASPVVTSSYRA